MKEKNTSDRLKEIMTEKGLRQIDILNKAMPICKKRNIKLGRNDLSQYISGKVEPSQKKLTILAEALDVSETWLMGYDVPKHTNLEQKIIIFRLTFYELLNYYKIKKEEFSKKNKIDIEKINDWLNFKLLPDNIDIFKICNFFNIENEDDLFNGTVYYNMINKYAEVFTGPDDRYKFGFVLESMLDDISKELNISTKEIKNKMFKRFKKNTEVEQLCEYNDLYDFILDYLKQKIK